MCGCWDALGHGCRDVGTDVGCENVGAGTLRCRCENVGMLGLRGVDVSGDGDF